MIGQFVVTVLIVSLAYYLAKADLKSDTEILNGQITAKESVHVSCSHSYSCHCHTDKKGNEHCDTCYEHAYDIDWNVNSTVGQFTIDRVDRRGTDEPPRWEAVQAGESSSKPHHFENFIKGAKFSIFNYTDNEIDKKFAAMIPSYPVVFDYYRVNRVIPVGVNVPNTNELNRLLNDQLRSIGPQKQANIVMVIVKTDDPNYRYALERAWIGGKKNDIVIVIGVTEYPKINWVDVITLGKNSNNELLQVQLRDQLMSLQTINDSATIINNVASIVNSDFHRKHMKDYAYLDNEIQPSMTVMMILFVFTLLCNIGVTIYFVKHQEWNDERYA